jgi:hypothetical protein
VVVPERGIRMGQETRFAWWRVDPKSGAATVTFETSVLALGAFVELVMATGNTLTRIPSG